MPRATMITYRHILPPLVSVTERRRWAASHTAANNWCGSLSNTFSGESGICLIWLAQRLPISNRLRVGLGSVAAVNTSQPAIRHTICRDIFPNFTMLLSWPWEWQGYSTHHSITKEQCCGIWTVPCWILQFRSSSVGQPYELQDQVAPKVSKESIISGNALISN